MRFFLNLWRKFRLNRKIKKIGVALENDTLDLLLESLLYGMKLFFLIDADYRRNIENFEARYVIQSKDGKIAASALFHNNKMSVRCKAVDDTNVTIIFKDAAALKSFLLSKDPDIIGGILDNSFKYIGNLNYLAKFAYMAKHLQREFGLGA